MRVILHLYLSLSGFLIPYFAVKLAIPMWAAVIQYLYILFIIGSF